MRNMQYEQFYDVVKELETKKVHFDAESLKRISYSDLILAGVGNAGKTICEDYKLIESERQRRLDALNDMTPDDIEKDIGKWVRIDDMSMVYELLNRRVENHKFTEADAPKWCLLTHYMKALRGDWSDGRGSFYLQEIYRLIPLVEKEGIVPLGWVRAVRNNADEFDGYMSDGRIMRDGQLYLDPEIAKAFGLEGTKASGDMAKMIGAVPVKQDGYRGSYEELFKELLTPKQKIEYLTPIEGLDMDD
jgi:hypothetical protein